MELVLGKLRRDLAWEEKRAALNDVTAFDADECAVWFTLGEIRAALAEHDRSEEWSA